MNNRELARALELKKAELSAMYAEVLKLRAENQAQSQELIKLRACTEKDNIATFEQEVKRQVDVSIDTRLVLLKGLFSVAVSYVGFRIEAEALSEFCQCLTH